MAAVAEAGYRALVPDMRGYGRSDAPEDPAAYTPFQTVGDLVGILEHFELADCVLVGHDFGARVLWNAAMMRPGCFRAVFGMSVPIQRPGGPTFLNRLRQAGRDDFYLFAQMEAEADTAWADAAVTIPGIYCWSSGQAPVEAAWAPFDASGMLQPADESLAAIDKAYLEEAASMFAQTGNHGALNYYRAIDSFLRLRQASMRGRQFTGHLVSDRHQGWSARFPARRGSNAGSPDRPA